MYVIVHAHAHAAVQYRGGSESVIGMGSKEAEEKAAEAEEDEPTSAQPSVANARHVPKDPRTKARYNIFSRLLFL